DCCNGLSLPQWLWHDSLGELENEMATAEAAVYNITSVDEALQLVLQLETSEINPIFDSILRAADSVFVNKSRKFRRAIEEHIVYIGERMPQLCPAMTSAAQNLVDYYYY
ncbi:MAG: hypothetical protein ACWGMZ_07835, partial [Thermoguttaceae bacterium]